MVEITQADRDAAAGRSLHREQGALEMTPIERLDRAALEGKQP